MKHHSVPPCCIRRCVATQDRSICMIRPAAGHVRQWSVSPFAEHWVYAAVWYWYQWLAYTSSTSLHRLAYFSEYITMSQTINAWLHASPPVLTQPTWIKQYWQCQYVTTIWCDNKKIKVKTLTQTILVFSWVKTGTHRSLRSIQLLLAFQLVNSQHTSFNIFLKLFETCFFILLYLSHPKFFSLSWTLTKPFIIIQNKKRIVNIVSKFHSYLKLKMFSTGTLTVSLTKAYCIMCRQVGKNAGCYCANADTWCIGTNSTN